MDYITDKRKLISNNISIDAEWSKDKFLSFQMALSDSKGMIIRYYIFTEKELIPYIPNEYKGVEVIGLNFNVGVSCVLDYFVELPDNLNCFFFYSPRDIEAFLGKHNWRNVLKNKKVEKRRNLNIKPYIHVLNGSKCKVRFRDLFGRFGLSLEEAYHLGNIDTSNGKDYINSLNIDKSNMDLFAKEHPQKFFEYALGDLQLHLLSLNLKDLMNEVVKDCFGIDECYRDLSDYPSTIGNMVNDLFLRWLNKNHPKVLKGCCLLSTTSNNKVAHNLSKYKFWCDRGSDGYKVSSYIQRRKSIIHGLGAASIPAFFPGNYGLNNTTPICAIVQGGRAINEEKDENLFHNVLDIDLSSAYGSSLTKFDYFFGLPTLFSNINEIPRRIRLKKFLHLYGEDLVDGAYVIYVSGFLDHFQDLVFSKYGLNSASIGSKLLSASYQDDDAFNGRLGGKFLLTSKQIELGIITSEVLDVIRKVSTSAEFKNWMNLNVEAAVYYPRSKELSLSEWSNKHSFSNQVGSFQPDKDKRSRNWCRISLGDFISPLLNRRVVYKKKRKEAKIFESKQRLLKLIINTVYGDLASPYFPMGNTVVANNVTASVRVGSWIMAKALACKIIVTDGGLYTPHRVPYMKTHRSKFKKPGFNTLYDYGSSNSIGFTDLLKDIPDLKLFILNECSTDILDSLALKHINNFCKVFDIHFPFSVEHKIEHSGDLAVTNPYGKVDYIIYSYRDQEVIRIRGVRTSDYPIHPKVEFLRALAEGRAVRFHTSLISQLIGVNDYISNPTKYEPLLPGQKVYVDYVHNPNSKGGFIFSTYEEFNKAETAYKMRLRRAGRKRIERS